MTPTARDLAATWRLFVAIRVPPAPADVIMTAARSLPPPGGPIRWVDPADLHITVWFIGQVAGADVAVLRERIAGVAATDAPFEVGLSGAGAFGQGPSRATWVGVAGPGAERIAALAGGLRDGPFHAHVTVCRGAPMAFAEAMAARLAGAPLLAWRASALELLRSHPGRRPAYETVRRFPLGDQRTTA